MNFCELPPSVDGQLESANGCARPHFLVLLKSPNVPPVQSSIFGLFEFSSEGLVRRLEGVSENVSLGGLLLNTGAEIPLHTKVSLTIDLASPLAAEPLRLIAQGKAVRVEPLVQAHGFAIAVERNHPISTVKKHLVASGSAHASFAVK